MEPIPFPRFQEIRWRWLAYGASAAIVCATVFAFIHEIELKQDVRCEIVAPGEIKL